MLLLHRLTHSTTGRLPDLRPDLLQVEVEVVPQAEVVDGSAHLSLTPSSVDSEVVLQEVEVDTKTLVNISEADIANAVLRDG